MCFLKFQFRGFMAGCSPAPPPPCAPLVKICILFLTMQGIPGRTHKSLPSCWKKYIHFLLFAHRVELDCNDILESACRYRRAVR
jgi:hypothetical protein